MNEIYKRLCAKTPVFFKRVAVFGASLAGTATAIIAIPHIPESLRTHAETGIWVGAVMALVAKMAVENTDEIKQ